MKVYCILGIEYCYGSSLKSIPKIYGIFKDKNKALEKRKSLLFSVSDMLSINEIEIE